MLRIKNSKLQISVTAPVLLAALVWLSSPVLLAAVLLAAICHELGHYIMLRLLGGQVATVVITMLGAEMRIAPQYPLSYGSEIIATLAGPVVNLLLALLLAFAGRLNSALYLFAGAQLILGAFNLLPITPLDGGSLLWIVTAWFTEPYTADKVAATVGLAVSLALLTVTALLGCRAGNGGFLVLMALWLTLQSLRRRLYLT